MLINRCGWHQTCPTENSDNLYEWHRWEEVEYKIDEETGKPKTQIDFVPHRGTRKDFMGEFKGMFAKWLSHDQFFKVVYQSFKKQEEYLHSQDVEISREVCISVCDYASQININRYFSSTCTHEKINCCVLVIASELSKNDLFEKGEIMQVATHKVVDSLKTLAVFYGIFDPENKPPAFRYNFLKWHAPSNASSW